MNLVPKEELKSGEVGYFTALIRDTKDVNVGDTVIDAAYPDTKPLAGFRKMKPVVFASIFPVIQDNYEDLRKAMDKLYLNDPSFVYET